MRAIACTILCVCVCRQQSEWKTPRSLFSNSNSPYRFVEPKGDPPFWCNSTSGHFVSRHACTSVNRIQNSWLILIYLVCVPPPTFVKCYHAILQSIVLLLSLSLLLLSTSLMAVAYRGGGLGGSNLPPPPKFRRPSKIVSNSTRLWKLLKIAEFKTPTPQDVRKKAVKF